MVALKETTRLETFAIEGVLGQGGFGITYLATDEQLDRRVAIKEYFPQFWANRDQTDGVNVTANTASERDYDWGLKSFLKEAKTLAKFKHPSIVHVNRIMEANGTAYMVLEYEDGDDFGTWLKKLKRKPSQDELDAITQQLLDALDVIHANKLLHRDIAPDNIFIRKNGTPVLLDFGSAREAIGKRTNTVTGFFKSGYSPTEQLSASSKHQGPWTDIYALAATLYRAVTGDVPPDAQDRVLDDELVPATEAAGDSYRDGFLKAIDAALALHYRDRPKSVGEWCALFGFGSAPGERAGKESASANKAEPEPAEQDDKEFTDRREKALAGVRAQLEKEAGESPEAEQQIGEGNDKDAEDPDLSGTVHPSVIAGAVAVFFITLFAIGVSPKLIGAALALVLVLWFLLGRPVPLTGHPVPEEGEHTERAREAREKMRAVLEREAAEKR